MRNTIITSALAAFTLVAVATPAAAETTTAYVEWEDLNLQSDAGIDVLEGRIAAAINEVCPRGEVRSLRDSMDAQNCRTAAQDNADEQVRLLRSGRVQILAINSNKGEDEDQG